MATQLDKDLTRETTVQVEGKPLLVTVTKDQTIVIKQKGKGKDIQKIEIPIAELFAQLTSGNGILDEDKAMICLTDFRSQYLTDGQLEHKAKMILERITVALIKGQ